MTTTTQKAQNSAETMPGVSRRTVAVGAAWSVPIIVASTATPALAASTAELTVMWTTTAAPAFVNSTFGTSEVTVTSAPAGAQVTFTLSANLMWADNTTASKLVTIVGGKATLPAVKAVSVGSHTVAAIVDIVSASTTLQATVLASGGDRIYNFTQSNFAVSPVPMVEMIVGNDWITVRTDDSRWYAYAYATEIFRPIHFDGAPLVIDGEIKCDKSNVFLGLSNGEIYELSNPGGDYAKNKDGVPLTAKRRGAPPTGIATWEANGATLYASTTAGEWYTSTSGTTWTKVDVPYPSGEITTAYSIQGGSVYGWAITQSGGVWCNQGSPKDRTNALSPMKQLAIGSTIAYGSGTDNLWYAKYWGDTTANWTRVQYNKADFILAPNEVVRNAVGGNYSYVLRGDREIYRTGGNGVGATQDATLITAPVAYRDIAVNAYGNILIAGEDGRVHYYNGTWTEKKANGESANALQVGFRAVGDEYHWAIGKD